MRVTKLKILFIWTSSETLYWILCTKCHVLFFKEIPKLYKLQALHKLGLYLLRINLLDKWFQTKATRSTKAQRLGKSQWKIKRASDRGEIRGNWEKIIGLEQALVKYFVILSEMVRHWRVLRSKIQDGLHLIGSSWLTFRE